MTLEISDKNAGLTPNALLVPLGVDLRVFRICTRIEALFMLELAVAGFVILIVFGEMVIVPVRSADDCNLYSIDCPSKTGGTKL